MIKEFIARFDASRQKLREGFKARRPDDYRDLVRRVVEVLGPASGISGPDPDRIHQINDGDYQGTLVFVIGEKGYQPSRYWAVLISYGSCSGCDTLEAFRGYGDDLVTDREAEEYLTLALHVVQGLRFLGSEA